MSSRMRHGNSALVIGAAIALLLLVDVGAADTKVFRDGDDTFGRLDIRRAGHSHQANKLVHRTRMGRSWRARLLRKPQNWIGFAFSTDADRAWERFIWVRHEKGKGLVATMYEDHPQYPVEIRNVSVWRPGRRSVAVSFGRDLLELDEGQRYRWRVLTSFQGSENSKCPPPGYEIDDAFPPEGACQDRAPNGDRTYRH